MQEVKKKDLVELAMYMVFMFGVLYLTGCSNVDTKKEAESDTPHEQPVPEDNGTPPEKKYPFIYDLRATPDVNMLWLADVAFVDPSLDVAVIESIKKYTEKVRAYVSCGTAEESRDNFSELEPYIKKEKDSRGKEHKVKLEGYDEYILDPQHKDEIVPILEKKFILAKSIGLTGVICDNAEFLTGVMLNELKERANLLALSFGFVNALYIVDAGEASPDFHVVEQCNQYGECNLVDKLVEKNVPIFHLEYKSKYCYPTPGHETVLYGGDRELYADRFERVCE
jgi:hypothetical protein